MEYINKKKFNDLQFAYGLRKVSKWHTILASLKVDEGVLIPVEEWDMKTPPTVFIRGIKKIHGHKLTGRLLADKSAWAVLRIK